MGKCGGLFLALLLTCWSIQAKADLPDLRGKTLYLYGYLRVAGTVAGIDFSESPLSLTEIDINDGARLNFAPSGPADNSQLTATLPLPSFTFTVNGVTYQGCGNPTFNLTGSFNRVTGEFQMTSAAISTAVLDMGVHDIPDFGINRVLVRVRNMGVNLRGTGKIVGREFRLEQSGGNTYPTNNVTFTSSPQGALVAPNSCSFPFLGLVISDASIKFEGWVARQARISGLLTLSDLAPSAAARPVRFDFRAAGTTNTLFSQTTLVGADGIYTLFNLQPGLYDVAMQGTGAEGSTYLRRVRAGVDTRAEDAPNINATLLPGDLVQDNTIDLFDLIEFFTAYGTATSDETFQPNADLTGDGLVDLFDLIAFFAHYGTTGDN